MACMNCLDGELGSVFLMSQKGNFKSFKQGVDTKLKTKLRKEVRCTHISEQVG